ncbi:MAG TPA: aldo/keto reductase [Solirubrobacteraceae bacterium]|nr:aldo/keto reductase [Solirubrobacteraceae bacterium]
METITLGKTGLEVSRICLGTWQFGGDWGEIDRDEAVATVTRARELGINFFDTAQGYGWGASEKLLAQALRGVPREQVVIATKGGLRREGEKLVRDSSAAWLRKGVEESLGHLDSDYVDIYQVHWPDAKTPFAETAAALEELVAEGKVRHVGASNFDAAQMADFERAGRLETLQPAYHMLRRDIEQSILPHCAAHDIGVLIYGPLAHGLLSGRFTRDTRLAPEDWRHGSDLFSGEAYRRNLEIVERLRKLAAELDITVAQLAIAWTLANPAVHVAIVGARRPDHVEGAAPAADVHLDDDALSRVEEILAQAAAVGGPSPEMV